MLNYIKAELYRSFHRANFWVYSGVTAGLALLLNIILKTSSVSSMNLGELFGVIIQMLIVPIFLVAPFIETTTGEESKNLTLKNAVSFGIPRSRIALSKVIVGIILSFISAIIIFTVFFGSGAILFGAGKDSLPAIKDGSLRILAAMPLWMGAVAVGTFIALFLNNNTAAAFVYAGVFVVIPNVVKLLNLIFSNKFSYISKILITTHLTDLKQPNVGSEVLTKSALAGLAYIILFTILSMLYIKRKEIR